LGTEFDVKLQDQQASVTVFEHAVKVTSASGEIKERLAEAEQLLFSADSISPPTTSTCNAPPLAPATHGLPGQTFAEVVAELNRYHPGKIVIVGDAIKNLPITGVFASPIPTSRCNPSNKVCRLSLEKSPTIWCCCRRNKSM